MADGLTKRKGESRKSLETFLKSFSWRFKYDPNFIRSAKKSPVKAYKKMEREQLMDTGNYNDDAEGASNQDIP